MEEQHAQASDQEGPIVAYEAEPAREAVRTGDSAVDDVLDEVEKLDELPVEEHVAVFERAHEDLRSALDRPGDQD